MLSALIMIDFINDIVHPQGAFASSAAEVASRGVLGRADALAVRAREAGVPVVLVRVGFEPGYPDHPDHSPLFGPVRDRCALVRGTWGTAFHAELNVNPDDTIIDKSRVSAFHETPLADGLSRLRTRRLVICGVATDMGVLTTARDAHDRDFQVTVAADACASGNPEFHAAALAMLARTGTVEQSEAIVLS